MKTIFLLCALSLVSFAQCTESSQASCTSTLSTSGVVSGSFPSITAIYNQAYCTSNCIDSSAQKVDIYYRTSLGTSSLLPCIVLNAHEGGGYQFDKGSFVNAGSSDYVVLAEGDHQCTILTFNYTLNTGSSPAISPEQQRELSCAAHFAVHFAGTLFPGNINDIRAVGFSWGTWADNLWNMYIDQMGATTCDYNDAIPPIKMVADFGQVWNFQPEYTAGSSAQFTTAVNEMLGSSPSTPAMNAVSPHTWFATHPGTTRQFRMNGTADSITVPSYQAAVQLADYQGATPPITISQVMYGGTPGCGASSGHGVDWYCGCFNTSPLSNPNYNLSQAYEFVKNALNNASSVGAGIGMGLGQ